MTRCRYCGNPIAFLQQYNWLRGKPEFCSEQHRLAFAELQTEGLKRLMALGVGLLEPDMARNPPVTEATQTSVAPAELVQESSVTPAIGPGLEPASFVTGKFRAKDYAYRPAAAVDPKTIRQHPATRRLNWHDASMAIADYVPVRFVPEMARPVDTCMGGAELRFDLGRPALPAGSVCFLSGPAPSAATAVRLVLGGRSAPILPRQRVAPVVALEEPLEYPNRPLPASLRELRAAGMIVLELSRPHSCSATPPAGSCDEVLEMARTPVSAKLTSEYYAPELSVCSILRITEWVRIANPRCEPLQSVASTSAQSADKPRLQWTVTRQQFFLRPSKLTLPETFPACTSRRIWVHPNLSSSHIWTP
jgi:hypothetical protein